MRINKKGNDRVGWRMAISFVLFNRVWQVSILSALLSIHMLHAQIIYEAEDGTLSGNAEAQVCDDCSGGQQIGSIEPGSFFTSQVNMAYAGQYTMKLSFSSGDARSIFISVNDTEPMELVCFSGSWDVVWTSELEVSLNAGANTIRFFNEEDGQFGPNIDKFTLQKNPIPALIYEAEAGTLSGNAAVQECSVCSNAEQVGNIGDGNGVLTNEVTVEAGGAYKMKLSYSAGDPRSVFISVNDQEAVEVIGYTGVWGVVGTKEVTINLQSGNNSIRFFNDTGFAPNLDKFELKEDPIQGVSYEAESGTLTGSAAIQECGACSGGQQVGNIDANGNFSSEINVSDSGAYVMTLSFSSGDPRSIFISTNNGDTVEVSCYSGNWGIVGTTEVPLILSAGSNNLSFFNDEGFGPNIDRFEIEKDPSPTISLEAENGILSGSADIQACGNCSGGNKVGNIGGDGNGLLSNELNVTEGGAYTMILTYESGDPRSVFISVNDSDTTDVIGDSGDWGLLKSTEVAISLKPGNNIIKFFNANGFGPNLDLLQLDKNLDIEQPTGFTAELGEITDSTIELLLSASDDSGEVTYEITYGDITETLTADSGIEASFVADGLDANTSYSFSIAASDASGNGSANNPLTIQATTAEEPDLIGPTDFTAEAGGITDSTIELLLSATDDSGEVTYEITYGDVTETLTANSGVETSFVAENLDASTSYSFSISATDASGNESFNSPIAISITTSAGSVLYLNKALEEMRIYPNPVESFLTIDWTGFKRVTVYSLSGKSLMVSSKKTFSVESLVEGAYMLDIVGAEGERCKTKIFKK
ncbi:MAG: CBM35 domain-containing protein [Cyclobacteriaceae bacterium]